MLKFAKLLLSPARSSTSSSDRNWHNQNWQAFGSSSILIVSLFLAACGFSPLYSSSAVVESVASELASITVQAPNNDANRALRLTLADLLRNDGFYASKYSISLTSGLAIRDVAVQQDTSVTRKNLVMSSTYSLSDLESGEILFESQATAIAAYNRVGSEFANIIAERDARERASTQVAEQIRTELAVFFERRHGR